MSTAQQLGLIGNSVKVQSLPTASAETFGAGNRFYTLIGQQEGYITGHTYRTVMANDVYSWEDVAGVTIYRGSITPTALSKTLVLSNIEKQPISIALKSQTYLGTQTLTHAYTLTGGTTISNYIYMMYYQRNYSTSYGTWSYDSNTKELTITIIKDGQFNPSEIKYEVIC